ARAGRADPLRLLVYRQVATALTLTVLVNKFNNTAWWYLLVMSTLPWTSRALLGMLGSARGARAPDRVTIAIQARADDRTRPGSSTGGAKVGIASANTFRTARSSLASAA